MTSSLDARLNTNSSAAVSIFDILVDFLYAVHGAPKLFAWPVDTGAAGRHLAVLAGWSDRTRGRAFTPGRVPRKGRNKSRWPVTA